MVYVCVCLVVQRTSILIFFFVIIVRWFRKVNESRGNRQGNSAFYREPVTDPMNIEYRRRKPQQNEMTVLSTLTKTQLTDHPHVMDTLYLAKCNGLIGLDLIYYSVASGNHLLAAKIIEDHTHTTWFNHLHINTLKVSKIKRRKSA